MTARGRSMVRLLCLAALACSSAPAPGSAQVGQLLPVDEASQNPGFFTFRAHLQAALARRDTAALLAVVSPTIRNSFGPNQYNGGEAFRRRWRLDQPDSPLWDELATILALGGSFTSDSLFAAPYVYSEWTGADAFGHVAIVGRGVRVRAEPSPDGAIIGALSFAVVAIEQPVTERDEWAAIRLDSGRVGYVAAQYVRSPVDYRAIFAREDGQWRMVTLIAGD